MKITLYTIPACQYSNQEKDYLKSHNLQFEEKNLESNKDYLTEMLAISNNFAGTPVTKVEKNDGKIAVLKGFTKDEFDVTLGFSTGPAASGKTVSPFQVSTPTPPLSAVLSPNQPTPPQETPPAGGPTPTPPAPPQPTPSDQPPQAPPQPTDQPPPTIPTSIEPPGGNPAPPQETPPGQSPPPQQSSAPAQPQDTQLSNLLNQLQDKANQPSTAPTPAPPPQSSSSVTASNLPHIPDPNFG